MRNDQSGFITMLLILVLIAIAVVVFAAYRVIEANSVTEESYRQIYEYAKIYIS